MPRSPEEHRRRAIKYGRRHRLLHAMGSQKDLDVVLRDLIAELRRSKVPRDQVRRLIAAVDEHRDITRRRSAIWAIVDALERAGG